jgi:hypothetical protein
MATPMPDFDDVYDVDPSLLDGASPDLRKQMQGKSCFTFSKVDEPLMNELDPLTRIGYERTAANSAWGAQQRVERGMAHRKARERFEVGTPG